ncbi:DUF7507 domain-containing protein, partial [Marinicella sediminis]|uniref:DUF7507 domain-containing protein n=1 Tax=Marinicella sediminis TaxID=1792834 RepID=UPI0012FFB5F9
MILLVTGMFWFLASSTAMSQTSETGDFCVRDYRSGAGCTANDVRIEALTVQNLVEDCNTGVIGETEVQFNALVSADGSPDRYDIGLFLATDGGSARDGNSCLHTFLAGMQTDNPIYGDINNDSILDIDNGPWWNGGTDLDSCGDIESNTQVFSSLPTTRFSCNDSNLDGSVDVSVCTSWDNNTNTTCNGLNDAFPGTNSKCSCDIVELGIAPTYTLLDKIAVTPIVESGTAATFTITATNTGIEDLLNVTLTDPQCDTLIGPAGDNPNTGELEVGETWEWSCTVNNVTAGFTNTATLTGVSEISGNNENQVATAAVQVADLSTVKVLTSNADEDASSSVSLFDTLTYTITVSNTGEVTLNNVTVSDPMITPNSTSCATVAPGGTCVLVGTYQVTAGDVSTGSITNTATGDSDQTGPDTDSIVVVVPSPELTVTKTAVLTTDNGGLGVADAGDVITFSVTVQNTGNVILDNLVVTDPMGGGTLTCTPTTLNPTDVATCTSYTYTVTQTDIDNGTGITNTATAIADDPDNNPVTGDDSTITMVTAANPLLSTAKVLFNNADEDGSGTISLNDTLTYTVTVTNTGNVTLNNVTVTDTLITPNSTSCASVAPTGTCILVGTYVVTQ